MEAETATACEAMTQESRSTTWTPLVIHMPPPWNRLRYWGLRPLCPQFLDI